MWCKANIKISVKIMNSILILNTCKMTIIQWDKDMSNNCIKQYNEHNGYNHTNDYHVVTHIGI